MIKWEERLVRYHDVQSTLLIHNGKLLPGFGDRHASVTFTVTVEGSPKELFPLWQGLKKGVPGRGFTNESGYVQMDLPFFQEDSWVGVEAL